MSKSFVYANLEMLNKMKDQGMSWPEMARASDYPGLPDALKTSYRNAMIKLGKHKPKVKVEERYSEEDVKSWGALRMSFSQVNALTGLSFGSVNKLCAKYDVKLPNLKSTTNKKISRDEIYRLSNEGLSQSAIALKLGCSRSVVGDVLGGRRSEYPVDEMPLSMQVPADIRKIALGQWRQHA